MVRVLYDIELAIREARNAGMPELEPYEEELRTASYREGAHYSPEEAGPSSRHGGALGGGFVPSTPPREGAVDGPAARMDRLGSDVT